MRNIHATKMYLFVVSGDRGVLLGMLDTKLLNILQINCHATGTKKEEKGLHKEQNHIRKAFQACLFPPLALNKLQHKFECKNSNQEPRFRDNPPNNENNNNRNISIVVPYIERTGERFKRTCNSKGIQVHFKGTNTLKTLLMAPKDKDSKLQKNGVIYQFKCPHINCPEEYIGESGRSFGDRIKEHLKAPSPINQHSNSTGHPISPHYFAIMHRESQVTSRNIKKVMYICVNDPSLSRNLGKYQLPHIWDNILQDTPALQLK